MTDFNPPRSDSRPKIRLDNIPGGTYGIQPGSSIGVTIFVRNYGEVSRSALLDIDLPEGWDWEWSDPMVQPGARVISIDSDVGIPISALIHASTPGPFTRMGISALRNRDLYSMKLEVAMSGLLA